MPSLPVHSVCIRTCLVSASSHVRLLIYVYFVHHCIWGSSISLHFVGHCLLGRCQQFVVCGVASANHIHYVLCATLQLRFVPHHLWLHIAMLFWQATYVTLLLHNVVSFVHHHFRSCCNVLFGHELWLCLFIMFYTMAERFWISCLLFLPCCSERYLILPLCFSFVLCIVPFFSSCHSMSIEAMLFQVELFAWNFINSISRCKRLWVRTWNTIYLYTHTCCCVVWWYFQYTMAMIFHGTSVKWKAQWQVGCELPWSSMS